MQAGFPSSGGTMQDQLCLLLQQTLDPRQQKAAERALKSFEESQPKFILDLAHLINSATLSKEIRLVASIYLKNHIKTYWTDETSTRITDIELRNQIKGLLLELVVQPFQPLNVQFTLTETIAHIAYHDFPQLWPGLLSSLIASLSMDNIERSNTVLGCSNAIFKRFRYETRSDELFLELKHVLTIFAPVLLELYKAYDSKWEQLVFNPNMPPTAESKATMEKILTGLLLLNRIFYSLNYQDLPEFFEDEMKTFMQFHQKYLNPLSFPPSVIQLIYAELDDDEVSLIERLKRSILVNINLYAFKYSEDFPFVNDFVPLVWNIIGEAADTIRNDSLIAESMGFLETVSKQLCNKSLFEDPAILKELVDRVIVKNILLRPCDVELFEDEPLEWIKRDVEGTTHEGSRRASATSLIRGLMTFHQDKLLPMFFEHVTKFMQINIDVSQCWKFKDASIFLFTAIAGSGGSALAARGVFSQINPLIQSKLDSFYSDYVMIDLEKSEAKNPLVIVDCISFLTTFRGFLPPSLILKSFPFVISLLGHSNEAVRNASYICIDRLLTLSGIESYRSTWQILVESANLSLTLQQTIPVLVGNLDALVASGNYQKLVANEFLLRALLRLIVVGKSLLSGSFSSLLQTLAQIFNQTIGNPSNPRFNHFLLESISFLTKYCCLRDSANYKVAEQVLFPTIQAVLRDDVTEFVPYVFQLLSLLLFLIPLDQLTVEGSGFCQLLGHVMHPSIWSNPSNISALVKFLFTFIIRYPKFIVDNYFNPVLGIVQMLLKSKVNDLNGLLLWNCLVKQVAYEKLAPFLKPITIVVLTKLQSSTKSVRAMRIATLFTATFIVCCKEAPENTAQIWHSLMESIQPGITSSFISGVLIKDAAGLVDQDEKLLVFFALTQLVPIVPGLVADLVSCMATLAQASPSLTDPIVSGPSVEAEDLISMETAAIGGQEPAIEGGDEEALATSSAKMASTAALGPSMLYRLDGSKKTQLLEHTRHVLADPTVHRALVQRFAANVTPAEITTIQSLYSMLGLVIR